MTRISSSPCSWARPRMLEEKKPSNISGKMVRMSIRIDGHLFQARFISEPVHDASHLLIVIRYIHRNPVKARICSDPGQYRYSSFKDYFDNDLIDAKIVLDLVSKEFFWSFNRTENDDQCMDIDQEAPRVLTDDIASKIMRDISGCSCAAEFQKLTPANRNKALREMRRVGISAKQANRITGISYKLIRKIIYPVK